MLISSHDQSELELLSTITLRKEGGRREGRREGRGGGGREGGRKGREGGRGGGGSKGGMEGGERRVTQWLMMEREGCRKGLLYTAVYIYI